MKRATCILFVLSVAGCAPVVEAPVETPDTGPSFEAALSEALGFHASFDGGPNADFARGDGVLYTAPSYDRLDAAEPGIGNPEVRVAEGAGRFGDALEFTAKNEHAIFFRAADNVPYTPSDWSGTISFWLSLNPAVFG